MEDVGAEKSDTVSAEPSLTNSQQLVKDVQHLELTEKPSDPPSPASSLPSPPLSSTSAPSEEAPSATSAPDKPNEEQLKGSAEQTKDRKKKNNKKNKKVQEKEKEQQEEKEKKEEKDEKVKEEKEEKDKKEKEEGKDEKEKEKDEKEKEEKEKEKGYETVTVTITSNSSIPDGLLPRTDKKTASLKLNKEFLRAVPHLTLDTFLMTKEEPHHQEKVKANEWFKDIVGASEPKFRKFTKTPFLCINKNLWIKNIENGRLTKAGRLSLVSMDKMMTEINQRISIMPTRWRKTVPIVILSRRGGDEKSSKFVDVSYLQGLPDNQRAVFQVASNFNAIESADENISPGNSATFTQDYVNDKTQGPIASISAGAAAICRVHAPFYDPRKPHSKWTQNSKRQLNFLKNLEEYFTIKNGYVVLNDNSKDLPDEKAPGKPWDTLLKSFLVAYHRSVQVTSTTRENGYYNKIVNENQLIDQVFSAALNINQGTSGEDNKKTKNIESKCKFLLKCAYESAYVSAIYHERKKLYLTLVGAGVFGNNLDWIYESILQAHLKWARHPNCTLKTVYIVQYSDLQHSDSFLQQLRNTIPYTFIQYNDGVPDVVDQRNAIDGESIELEVLPKSAREGRTEYRKIFTLKQETNSPNHHTSKTLISSETMKQGKQTKLHAHAKPKEKEVLVKVQHPTNEQTLQQEESHPQSQPELSQPEESQPQESQFEESQRHESLSQFEESQPKQPQLNESQPPESLSQFEEPQPQDSQSQPDESQPLVEISSEPHTPTPLPPETPTPQQNVHVEQPTLQPPTQHTTQPQETQTLTLTEGQPWST
eukprot:TRINITY_DN4165_c0_g2_i4.p1 TRINITY_DN4165_c0_g2~~TRINITY_DN4165_c0_g2_i4.p1  ORF type:complete len:819 (+),score=199.11 TRINITY_DN4165_c0_g2_i4:42-2498(+)